jgi:hypothetical protein
LQRTNRHIRVTFVIQKGGGRHHRTIGTSLLVPLVVVRVGTRPLQRRQ